MKVKPFYILLPCFLVIVIVLIFCFHTKMDEPAGTPPDETTEIEEITETTETEPEEAVTLPPVFPPYSATFFSMLPAKLPAKIAPLTKNCKAGIAVDLDTRQIRWGKNIGSPLTIASITKMMTAYLAIQKMRASNGTITLQTPIQVTRTAAGIGGREVWLDSRETFTFDEILKCVLIHSANDAAYLLAEFCAGGDEDAFVAEMNRTAAAMGCTGCRFYNSHGLPEKNGPDNCASPIELAYLAIRLMEYPEIMKWTGVKTEYIRENDEAFKKRNKGQATMLSSSNTLLGTCPGVNGMKTGYTDKAQFCIVATCERNGHKTCVVLLGSPSKKDRDLLAKALINWLYTL